MRLGWVKAEGLYSRRVCWYTQQLSQNSRASARARPIRQKNTHDGPQASPLRRIQLITLDTHIAFPTDFKGV